MAAHGTINDSDRYRFPRMRDPVAPGVWTPLDGGAMRRLRGRTRTSHRPRNAHALPLTGMGWAVVMVASGLLTTLAVLALLVRP